MNKNRYQLCFLYLLRYTLSYRAVRIRRRATLPEFVFPTSGHVVIISINCVLAVSFPSNVKNMNIQTGNVSV